MPSGSAHGHVGEFSSAAVSEEVGGVESCALTAMNRCGITEGELFWPGLFGPQSMEMPVVHQRRDCARVRVDFGDLTLPGVTTSPPGDGARVTIRSPAW